MLLLLLLLLLKLLLNNLPDYSAQKKESLWLSFFILNTET
jgi:hypothetical protein